MTGPISPLERFVSLYVNGFITGMSSTLATFVPQVPEGDRDRYVQDFVQQMLDDPAVREEIRQQVVETLTGTDTGSKNLTVMGGDGS